MEYIVRFHQSNKYSYDSWIKKMFKNEKSKKKILELDSLVCLFI